MRFEGVDGAGVPRRDYGIAEIRVTCDSLGNQTEQSFFDVAGRPNAAEGLGRGPGHMGLRRPWNPD